MSSSSSNSSEIVARCNSYKELQVLRRQGSGVLVIQFNRNIISRRTIFDLIRALADAQSDEQIQIIVLLGTSTVFSLGYDLRLTTTTTTTTTPPTNTTNNNHSTDYLLMLLVKKLLYCRKVLVALVQGDCIGLGVMLCALCDIIYATETAQFRLQPTDYYLSSVAGASYILPYRMGPSKAYEMLLLGNTLDAKAALECGFVANVMRPGHLDKDFWPHIEEYGRQSFTQFSQQMANKRLLQKQTESRLLQALFDENIEHKRFQQSHSKL